MPLYLPSMGEDTRTPFGSFNFQVAFEKAEHSKEFAPAAGVPEQLFGGFQEITGLEAMMEHKAIKEGGRNYGTVMRAGQVTFGTVIMKRGIVSSRHLWRWWSMFAGADGDYDALPTPEYRADVLIGLIGFALPKADAEKKKKDDGGYHYENKNSYLGGAVNTSVKVDAYNSFSKKPEPQPTEKPAPPALEVKLGWRLRNAMPVKFRVGDLNAKGSEVAIEELHLVHEGLDMEGVA
jgi:phage tail-like protein